MSIGIFPIELSSDPHDNDRKAFLWLN